MIKPVREPPQRMAEKPDLTGVASACDAREEVNLESPLFGSREGAVECLRGEASEFLARKVQPSPERNEASGWHRSGPLSCRWGLFSEPVNFQAIAQERPGAMETRPEVSGADLEQFASPLGAQAIDFPEEKRIGQAAREPRQAGAENVPEFTRFEDRTRVASPGVRHGTPVSAGIERRVVDWS